MVAISNQKIGVDIERKADTNLGIAFRFFTKSEGCLFIPLDAPEDLLQTALETANPVQNVVG